MATSDEYRELREAARDALRRLLDESDHGSGMAARRAYAVINDELDKDRSDATDAVPPITPPEDLYERDRRLRAEWKRKPRREREHLVLNALGDDHLSVRELTERMHSDHAVFETHIRYLVSGLQGVGELDRVGERRARGNHSGAIRYRYFRPVDMSGSLAELDRAFHDDTEEGQR